ncbi:MAG: ribonuclease Z [archaeon]|jgi:ribonuclease Z
MEKIKLTILGTSGSVPQKDKTFASVALTYCGQNLLFDCPEGNQRQLMNSTISLMKIDTVFISHLHADHFLGLFGWIATMTLNERREKLIIYSPIGGKQKFEKIMKETIKPCFEIEYREIKTGVLIKNELLEISAFPLKHEISCFGFVIKEKDKDGEFDRKKAEKLGIPPGPLYAKLVSGKTITVNGKKFTKKDVFNYSKNRVGRKIVIVSDTRPVPQTIAKAKDADLLIHESSFVEEFKDKAIASLHSTAKEAGEIAKKANVKKLVLYHFSARINDSKDFEKEAKKEFTNTSAANDLDIIEV